MTQFNFRAWIILCVLLAGCASVPDSNPLPSELVKLTVILDIPGARFWADGLSDEFLREWSLLSASELQDKLPSVYDVPYSYLAISDPIATVSEQF